MSQAPQPQNIDAINHNSIYILYKTEEPDTYETTPFLDCRFLFFSIIVNKDRLTRRG